MLFHATSAKAFVEIMKTDTFKLAQDPVFDTYYMSFSRNPTNQFIPYLMNLNDEDLDSNEAFNPRKDMFVVLTVNGKKLSANHKGRPFNTHYYPHEDDNLFDLDNSDYEREWSFQEDKLLSQKPEIKNASSFITHVSIIANDPALDRKTQNVIDAIKSNKRIYLVAKATQSKFRFTLYANVDDYLKKRPIKVAKK